MTEEIFDVVNDLDEVIDSQPRSVVHRLGLKHRATHVLVFSASGSLFLQKRSLLKDTAPGKWDSSASGHLNKGEDFDACAARELREELGLVAVIPPERLFKIAACPETGQEFVWVYRCLSGGPFTLAPNEIDRGEWFLPDELDVLLANHEEDFAPSFRLVWRLFRAGCKDSLAG